MRVIRRFQPTLDGLPIRIAPCTVVAVAPIASAPAPTFTASDSDMPQTGTASPIILAPPPTCGSLTLVC